MSNLRPATLETLFQIYDLALTLTVLSNEDDAAAGDHIQEVIADAVGGWDALARLLQKRQKVVKPNAIFERRKNRLNTAAQLQREIDRELDRLRRSKCC